MMKIEEGALSFATKSIVFSFGHKRPISQDLAHDFFFDLEYNLDSIGR